MRGTASHGAARVQMGYKEIATDQTSGQTKRTRRFHHQDGKISAAPTTTLKRFIGTLYPLLTASRIDTLVLDGQGDGSQQAHGVDGPGRVHKLTHPTSHLIAGVVVGQRPCEVRQVVIRVLEGVGVRILLERIVRQRDFDVLKGHHTVKTKFGSRAVEGRDGNGVVEYIVEPAQTSGAGLDIQPRFEESEVVTFSRPEHHAVLSQSDWLRVTIHREVTDSEGHMNVLLRIEIEPTHPAR